MTANNTDTTAADEQDTTTEQGGDSEQQEPATTESPKSVFTRRSVLTSAGLLGLLGLGASSASAAGDSPTGKVGTDSNPLNELYTAKLYGSDGSVQLGANLDINGNNLVRPTTSVSSATTISVGDYFVEGDTSSSGFTITLPSSPSTGEEHIIKKKNGANSLTIDGNGNNIDGSSSVSLSNNNDARKVVYDGSEWQTQSEFIPGGSSVSELKADGRAALKAYPGSDGGITGNRISFDTPNLIGGHPNNSTDGNEVEGAVVVSGGNKNDPNLATDSNTFVGSGRGNEAKANRSVVVGGNRNKTEGTEAFVGGGDSNKATSNSSMVPGGADNKASGKHSFAAGRKAKTETSGGTSHDGAFVWGDSSTTKVRSAAADEVRFQATGGFVVESGNVDAQGGTVENTTGSLTVTTNDNGNLTLNPGSNKELQLSNQSTTSSDDSLLAIDGSGNVKEASSTSLNDVGAGPKTVSLTATSQDWNHSDEEVILVDTSSNYITIHLNEDLPDGHIVRIVDITGNASTVNRNIVIVADTTDITGPHQAKIQSDYGYRMFVSDGGNWREISSDLS